MDVGAARAWELLTIVLVVKWREFWLRDIVQLLEVHKLRVSNRTGRETPSGDVMKQLGG